MVNHDAIMGCRRYSGSDPRFGRTGGQGWLGIARYSMNHLSGHRYILGGEVGGSSGH